MNLNKLQLFEKCTANRDRGRLFIKIFRYREIKMVLDGNEITQIQAV